MLLSHDDFLSRPLEQEWLIEGLLPPAGAMVLYGPEKLGKSFLAMQLGVALTGERTDWIGFTTKAHGPVAYIQLDTSPPLWQARWRVLGFTGKNMYHGDLLSFGLPYFDILNPEHAQLLQMSIAQVQPVATIIDTARETHFANENDSTEMKRVVNSLLNITHPSALILITHSRKPNEATGGGSLTSEIRGSTYLAGKMDAVVKLSKGSIRYVGRAIEAGRRKIKRTSDGLWVVVEDTVEPEVHLTLEDPLLRTDSERAKALAEKLGIPFEAARSKIRRGRKTD